jgi:hypothetical protein
MSKLLFGAALALCLMLQPSKADIIDVGINPTSNAGHFSNDVGGGVFSDQITFRLLGAPAFVTFASATNDFAQTTDFITAFTGQLFNSGADFAPGGGDDFAVNPLVLAVPCQQNPGGCQVLAGSAILNEGFYFLNIEGIGGGTSGYGGNLTTAAVPGPIVGAGLPGLILGCLALLGFGRLRRRVV